MRSAAILLAGALGEEFSLKSDVQIMTDKSFPKVIEPARTLTVSTVLFYKSGGSNGEWVKAYEEFATKTRNWFPTGAIDCSKFEKFCKGQGVKEFPSVYIYPMTPMSKFKYAGEPAKLYDTVVKSIPSVDVEGNPRIRDIADASAYKSLVKSNPGKVKIIFFSEGKKKPPTLFKALATNSVFSRTVDFRFVGADKPEVYKAAGATKDKKMQMMRPGKNEWYKNKKDYSFDAIYEWINVYQESGMGDSVRGASGAHDESVDDSGPVPEFQQVTSKECFGQTAMCGIYLTNGPIEPAAVDDILTFEQAFAPVKERGIKYTWMWMDLNEEKEFLKALQTKEDELAISMGEDLRAISLPSFILVKPPKKKREESQLTYVKVPNGSPLDKKTVGALVEKVSAGSTYTRVKLPAWASRKKGERKHAPRTEL